MGSSTSVPVDEQGTVSMAGMGLKSLTIPGGEAAQQVSKVDLSSNALTRLPKNINSLINVTELDLRQNQLSSLMDPLGFQFLLEPLTELRILDLSFNHLKKLPNGMGALKNLEVLNIRGNALKKLPSEMKALTGIKRLYLEYNRFKQVPPEVEEIGAGPDMELSVDRSLLTPTSHLYIQGGQLVAVASVKQILAYELGSTRPRQPEVMSLKHEPSTDFSLCPDTGAQLRESEHVVEDGMQLLTPQTIEPVQPTEQVNAKLMTMLLARECGGARRRGGGRRPVSKGDFAMCPDTLPSASDATKVPAFSHEEQVLLQMQYPPWRNCRRLDSLRSAVFCTRFAPDGSKLVAATQSGLLRVYDMAYGLKIKDVELTEIGWSVLSLDVSMDSRFAVVAAWSESLRLCSLEPGSSVNEKLELDPGFHAAAFSVKFSSENGMLFAGLNHGFAVQYDMETRRKLAQVRAHTEDVNGVCELGVGGRVLAT
eukprot:CAMPEP_0181292446 /NCGR_PEP_ID=MMETSP1101-20121128/2511_1 /TAXON_ID=46948 /ORGANISM="Rhodomonas abbreviata, Strain Caron Lab Isolate" /LENGTH=480 /DNA_ID=CAMNT_0023396917 /DNA_START=82 /DNA_END=1520 /DNA_ORIENTATION=+